MKRRPANPPPRAPSPKRPPQPPSANPLVQPQARWQRARHYVWDKKRG